jgi:hypothetical protein
MEENVTLDPDLVNAIGKLRIFNTPIEPTGADPKQDCINHEAVDSLQGSFARFTHAPHPAPILTWPIYAKRESVYGLRALQPFKLLFLRIGQFYYMNRGPITGGLRAAGRHWSLNYQVSSRIGMRSGNRHCGGHRKRSSYEK